MNYNRLKQKYKLLYHPIVFGIVIVLSADFKFQYRVSFFSNIFRFLKNFVYVSKLLDNFPTSQLMVKTLVNNQRAVLDVFVKLYMSFLRLN